MGYVLNDEYKKQDPEFDPEILSLIIKLNQNGFQTTGSCAGHKDSQNIRLTRGEILIVGLPNTTEKLELLYNILRKYHLKDIRIDSEECNNCLSISFLPIGSPRGTSRAETSFVRGKDHKLEYIMTLNPAAQHYAKLYDRSNDFCTTRHSMKIPVEIKGYITEKEAESIRSNIDHYDDEYCKLYSRIKKISKSNVTRKPKKVVKKCKCK